MDHVKNGHYYTLRTQFNEAYVEHSDFTVAKGKNLPIYTRWPSYARDGGYSAEFAAMAGCTLVRIGTPVGLDLEGGGLAVEYIPKGETASRIVLFEFNELGLWPFNQTDHVPATNVGD